MGFLRTRIMGGGIGRRGFPATDVPSTEADALIRLYNATNGDSWSDNTNWKTDTTVGNWYGVTVAGGHVTEINLNNNNLDGEWSVFELTPFTALVNLYVQTNANVNCSFTFADLPNSFRRLRADDTSSTITGALSDIPGVGASFVLLNLANSDSVITGGASAVEIVNVRFIWVNGCSLPQANVDDILNRIHADRDSFTYATPALYIGGDNAAPTGTVQNTCPPTDPAEKLYNLAHAQCAGDTHETWTISYNGGTEP